MTDTYFIGYDAREHEAAAVCAYSIARHTRRRSKIYLVEHRQLRSMGLFNRAWRIDAKGQYTDVKDKRPFSTEFSHSRFLVFHLARALKCTSSCAFVDCDWLFKDDPGKMLREHEANRTAVSCVHRYQEIKTATKMDGMEQHDYTRKLWSALFAFTPSDMLADRFSPQEINRKTGRELHGFLGMSDDEIGKLDQAWHFVPSMDRWGDDEPVPTQQDVKGIHYSEFSPWINPDHMNDSMENHETFGDWNTARLQMLGVAGRAGRFLHVDDLQQDILKCTDVG